MPLTYMAAAVVVKVRTARLMEGRGENVCNRSVSVKLSVWASTAFDKAVVMRFCKWSIVCDAKMVGSLRLVTRRVFEGGDGWTSGGRSDRSNERPERLDVRDRGGVVVEDILLYGDECCFVVSGLEVAFVVWAIPLVLLRC